MCMRIVCRAFLVVVERGRRTEKEASSKQQVNKEEKGRLLSAQLFGQRLQFGSLSVVVLHGTAAAVPVAHNLSLNPHRGRQHSQTEREGVR